MSRLEKDIGRRGMEEEAADTENAEPAADRMKRCEMAGKSNVILYRSMKRNEHDHPFISQREGSRG